MLVATSEPDHSAASALATRTSLKSSGIQELPAASSLVMQNQMGRKGGLGMWRAVVRHAVLAGVFLATFVAAGWVGVHIRKALYLETDPIRFSGDISNGYNWGAHAADRGVVKTYLDLEIAAAESVNADYGLDYPPLRLWIMTQWVKWTRQQFDNPTGWRRDYAFSAPLLMLNTVACGLSSVAVFAIVWRTARQRARRAGRPTEFWTGVLPASIGAMLMWFNPAALLDGHAFPQWDLWIMPFFLFAVLLAMMDRWFWSGVLIGVGVLIKGQLLWCTPVLVLWPIFAGRWTGALRWIIGMSAAVAACTVPWSIQRTEGWVWLGTILLAAAVLTPALLSRGRSRRRNSWLFVPAAGLAGWPIISSSSLFIPGAAILIAILGLVRILPTRALVYVLIACLAVATFACVPRFGGSTAWFDIGFEYGSRKYGQQMFTIGTSNLCTILANRFGWSDQNALVQLPFPIGDWTAVPLRYILISLLAIGMLLCAIAAAMHDRRGGSRLLLALSLPFVLFYTLMPQMHDRYLIWGATATVLAAGVSLRMTVLHLVFTVICSVAILGNLLGQGPHFWPQLRTIVDGMHTDIAYALLLATLLMLVEAMTPERRQASVGVPAPG